MMSKLYQRDEWNARKEVVEGRCEWGAIPDAERFLRGDQYGYEKPREVHGWGWSSTFGKWSALVTFEYGWHGWTYPEPARVV